MTHLSNSWEGPTITTVAKLCQPTNLSPMTRGRFLAHLPASAIAGAVAVLVVSLLALQDAHPAEC
jgi:hypothetical protein